MVEQGGARPDQQQPLGGQEIPSSMMDLEQKHSTDSSHSSSDLSHTSIVQENLLLVEPPPDHPTHDGTGSDDYDDPWWMVWIKNVVSAALLVFCFTLLTAAIFTQQTRATSDDGVHLASPLAFCLFLLALMWLAIIEGSLNCLVGLRPLPKHLFKESHPLAYRASKLCQKQHGHNLERFIVGRQYMDLTMVFTISFLATAVKGATVLGLPEMVCAVFLNTGLAVTLVTIVLGQLVLQINAAHCMLDYMNNYAMLASTYCSLFLESTGVCHIVYLVQRIAVGIHHKHAQAMGATDSNTNAAPAHLHKRTLVQECFFWIRVLFSASLLTFALVTVVHATLNGDTKIWEGVPPWASFVLFFFLVFLVGMMDALQIALVAVVHIPKDQLLHRPTAAANADYVILQQRLPSFLLGRQIGQTVIQFLLTRLLTLDVPLGTGENIWGVSDIWQKIFNSGGLGAIIATVLASLIWRVLASEFPLMFLSSPFSRPIIALCLGLERTGIINIAWSLASLQRKALGMQTDETYLGHKAILGTASSSKAAAATKDEDAIKGCSSSETTTGDLTTQNFDLDQLLVEVDNEDGNAYSA